MINLKAKYLIQKLCFGLLFIWYGINKYINDFIKQIFGTYNFKTLIISTAELILMLACIAAYIISKNKKSEVEDELAQKHNLQAKSFIYKLLITLGFMYGLIGIQIMHLNLSININMIEIIFGICLILEYFLFMYYEKQGDFND